MSDEISAAPSRKTRILNRLAELGAEPKRALGQNFLISDHVVGKILQAVQLERYAQLIEVGPGLGALTEDLLLLSEAQKVALLLLELDHNFVTYWTERAKSSPVWLRVVEGDALKLPWDSLQLPHETLFVSNLPYQISSSLVIERSLQPAGVTRMILMFQKEVAQRLAAVPRTKDYGLLTVVAQSFWDVRKVCDASAQDFFPAPNVSSRVMMFRKKALPWLGQDKNGPTAEQYFRFVKAAFSHRRKLMSRNLQQEYFSGIPDISDRLEPVFRSQGLKATARAEELDPDAFTRLYLAARTL